MSSEWCISTHVITAVHMYITAVHGYITAVHVYITAVHVYITAVHMYITAVLMSWYGHQVMGSLMLEVCALVMSSPVMRLISCTKAKLEVTCS